MVVRPSMRLVLSALAVLSVTAANAADVAPSEAPPPTPGIEVPIFTWTGGYIGLQGGYSWADAQLESGAETFGGDFGGGMFGGFAGYNWQAGPVVFGVEGDASAISNDERFSSSVGDVEVGTDYLASLRGRLGYAWDRVMVYGTGGVAFADASANGVVNGASLDTSRDLTGWTVGAGVDYAITNNWVGRVEYRYYDFSNEDFGDLSNVDLDFNTVSVGISYKF
ncbi:outer membrane protein [Mesorhizobium xinjiangense]|uniref:outer membrane protein n=1 Tax=Mesorhizobium xinjiangense TaxID=2678685 RepID=UPI0012ED022B|nr:outer membrane protein [Mesorhizobium xinjiangense]